MQFNFGKNWDEFSARSLDEKKADQAIEDFSRLFSEIELSGKTFLDIGFGQGLSLLSATKAGATTTGCDINPLCAEVLKKNIRFFEKTDINKINIVTGSVLENKTIENIKSFGDSNGKFHIVHSWGVLHHTGDMAKAIDNTILLTDKYLVIAIYNKHWSSLFWKYIKWVYNVSPSFIKKLIVYKFYLIIAVAKFIVTGKNPFVQKRGMSFYYDVIDWVGGYPYEYATVEKIQTLLEKKGFKLIKLRKPVTPTGCNEFVFEKI